EADGRESAHAGEPEAEGGRWGKGAAPARGRTACEQAVAHGTPTPALPRHGGGRTEGGRRLWGEVRPCGREGLPSPSAEGVRGPAVRPGRRGRGPGRHRDRGTGRRRVGGPR